MLPVSTVLKTLIVQADITKQAEVDAMFAKIKR